jgi:hypothetical protein
MEKYASVPSCLPYHPQSELNGKAGYYPNISQEQLKAANELIALIERAELEFNHDGEDEFLKLLRFLRARKFNVSLAYKMVEEDVRWRKCDNRKSLRKATAADVLGCDLGKLFAYFPTWIQGFDKQHRPVSYRKFGQFEIWNVLKLTSMEKLIRFHAWETEMALNRMKDYSKDTGYNVETFLLIVDSAGWNLSLATSDAFTFIKGMATTDSDHYPERLGTVVVINAPSVLAIAWRVVQGFLDPVTKQKIKIFSSNRQEWEPVLQQFIDRDQIPLQYGGTAPDPTAEEALSSMNPAPASPVHSKHENQMELNRTKETFDEENDFLEVADRGTQTDDLDFYILEEELERSSRSKCIIS